MCFLTHGFPKEQFSHLKRQSLMMQEVVKDDLTKIEQL